jgi:hypothetical protein
MKQILLAASIFLACNALAQPDTTWYGFKGNTLIFIAFSSQYLTTGIIENGGAPNNFSYRADTFSIKQRIIQDDSTFFIITSHESNIHNGYSASQHLMLQKFRHKKLPNNLTTYFFSSLKSFFELTEKNKNPTTTDIINLTNQDTSNDAYLNFYTKDSVETYLKYPKLIDLSKDRLLQLYEDITTAYEKINALPLDKKMAYKGLTSMYRSAVETPILLHLKIYPLLDTDIDKVLISEKLIDDVDILYARYKLRDARR